MVRALSIAAASCAIVLAAAVWVWWPREECYPTVQTATSPSKEYSVTQQQKGLCTGAAGVLSTRVFLFSNSSRKYDVILVLVGLPKLKFEWTTPKDLVVRVTEPCLGCKVHSMVPAKFGVRITLAGGELLHPVR